MTLQVQRLPPVCLPPLVNANECERQIKPGYNAWDPHVVCFLRTFCSSRGQKNKKRQKTAKCRALQMHRFILILLDIEHANENEEPATVLLISNRRSGRQRVFGNHQHESLHLVDAGQSKSLQLWEASIAREVIGNAFRTENR
jgi:hypothetical protein